MPDVSEVTRQLADIDSRLRALPDDAFAEKHALLKKQDELRAKAAQYAIDADAQRPTNHLLAELSGLRSQLREIEQQRIDLVTQAGGGATGMGNMTNLGGVSINAQMAESQGAGRLQARIGVIKNVLTERGVEVPEAL